MPAAGGFLPGVEDILGHTAGWRRRKLGEEPARICCASVRFVNHGAMKYYKGFMFIFKNVVIYLY